MDTGVRLVVEQVTKRMPDGDRREQVGGNLVQERLERVIVVAVDEHHVDVRLAQLPRSADPGEPSARGSGREDVIPASGRCSASVALIEVPSGH